MNLNEQNSQTLILYVINTDEPNSSNAHITQLSDAFVLHTPTSLPQLDNNESSVVQSTQPEMPVEVLQPTAGTPSHHCSKCSKTFANPAEYSKHLAWHSTERKYKCDKCSASFNNANNIQIHQALHQEGKPMCPICNVSFQRAASLKSHLMVHQVEELYTCEECSAEFERTEDLHKHLQGHFKAQETSLICSYCKMKFEDSSSYREHVARHVKLRKMVLGKKVKRCHGKKVYPNVCDVCGKTFPKLSLLERHARVHSGERPFVCYICNRGFTQKGTLQIHLSKHMGVKPFHCTLCSARFNQKGNLRVHVEKTHTSTVPDMKIYKCNQCSCIFKKVASLNVHMTKAHKQDASDIRTVIDQLKEMENKNTDESNVTTSYVKLAESISDGLIRRYTFREKLINDTRWYLCNDCNKAFKKPSDLIRHTRVHTGEKPFRCKRCPASFALKSTLHSHVETHIDVKNYICPVCLKKFPTLRAVNCHLRSYSVKKNKKYKCTICRQSFDTWKEFHLHTHSAHSKVQLKSPLVLTPNGYVPTSQPARPEKDYKFFCTHCRAKFISLSSLNRHMYVHDREKRYKCEHCDKAYNSMSVMKEHQKVHSGIHNYECQQCDKRFANTSALKRHAKTHSSEKPFFCPYCDKQFKSVVLCRQHIETHKKDLETLEAEKLDTSDPPLNITLNEEPKNTENKQPVLMVNYDDLQLSENLLFNALDFQDPSVFNIEQESFNNEIFANPTDTNVANKSKSEEMALLFNLDTDFTTMPEMGLAMENPPQVEPQERPQFICSQCSQSFDSKQLLDEHVKSHGFKLAPHLCTHCDKKFKKHSDLVRHIRTHTGEKPFSCDKCDKAFSLKSTLLSHQKTHNPVSLKSYNCSVCNSFFSTKSSLKVHMNVHTGAKPHQCSSCDLKFRTAAHKRTHELTHSTKTTKRKTKPTKLLESVAMDVPNRPDPTPTPPPPPATNTLDNILIVDDALHLANEPLILQQLPADFIVSENLLQPLMPINEEPLIEIERKDMPAISSAAGQDGKPRNLECEICHKRYASKDVLRKHKKIHGVNKPFPCTKCDRGFNTLDDLQAHDKMHDGLRPFTCVYCDNSFAMKHGLTTHMKRIHQVGYNEIFEMVKE